MELDEYLGKTVKVGANLWVVTELMRDDDEY
jgi:hypothetical protein